MATSLELRFLVDRHLEARCVRETKLANVYAHAAEGVLNTALPRHADAIAMVASRKGDGHAIGSALAQNLTPASAAAVSVIWMLRGARRPAIEALSAAFRNNLVFNDTIRVLCARALSPAGTTEAAKPPPIEIAAAYRR